MANNNISIIANLRDNVSGAVKKMRGNTSTAISGMKKSFGGLQAIIAGTVAIALKSMIDYASGIQESLNKANVLAEGHSKKLNDLLGNVSEYSRLSKGQVAQYFGDIQGIVSGAGLTFTKTAKLTEDILVRSADISSFHNRELNLVIQDIQSSLAGSTETLKKYGISATVTNLQNTAFKKGITETNRALTEEEKILATLELIMERTNNASGDLANTSHSMANQFKFAGENAKKLGGVIGTVIGGALYPFIRYFNWATQVVEDHIKAQRRLKIASGDITLQLKETSKAIDGLSDSASQGGLKVQDYVDEMESLRDELKKLKADNTGEMYERGNNAIANSLELKDKLLEKLKKEEEYTAKHNKAGYVSYKEKDIKNQITALEKYIQLEYGGTEAGNLAIEQQKKIKALKDDEVTNFIYLDQMSKNKLERENAEEEALSAKKIANIDKKKDAELKALAEVRVELQKQAEVAERIADAEERIAKARTSSTSIGQLFKTASSPSGFFKNIANGLSGSNNSEDRGSPLQAIPEVQNSDNGQGTI